MLGWGLLSFSEKETGVVLLSPFLSFLSFHSSFSLCPFRVGFSPQKKLRENVKAQIALPAAIFLKWKMHWLFSWQFWVVPFEIT